MSAAASPMRSKGPKPGPKARAAQVSGSDEDSDNNLPLLSAKVSELNQVQKTKVELNENPWSIDFAIGCSNLAWYGNPEAPYPVWLMKQRETAVYRKEIIEKR
jgi:hypothetical protein